MKTAFETADILLPKENIDMKKWSVIACDQFTYERNYWEDVKNISNGEKSTINLILPEVYLNDDNCNQRIESINSTMKQYLNQNVFTEYKDSFIYVERIQSNGKKRCGIIGKIDLEQYDYNKGSTSQVRATEATVIERIPPRLKVRKNAPIELTHIMILIDDSMKTVIEPLGKVKNSLRKLYEIDLMKGSGHIEGYLINNNTLKNQIDNALYKLLEENRDRKSVV